MPRILSLLMLIAAMLPIMPLPAIARAAEERPAPVQAVLEFVDALQAGDANRLTQAIWVPADRRLAQSLGRDAFVKLVVAGRRLERAAKARFGEDESLFRYDFAPMFTLVDRKGLDQAQVFHGFEGGPVARIYKDGETSPILLRSTNNRWQIVMGFLSDMESVTEGMNVKPDPATRLAIDRLSAIAAAMEDLAARLENGQATSADDTARELTGRLETINAESATRRQGVIEHLGPGWNRDRDNRDR